MADTPAPEFRGIQFGRNKISLGIVILAMVFIFAFPPGTHASELKPSLETTKPDFILQDLDGKTTSLKALKGRTVLVHFFATWCEPCREELPALSRFRDRSAATAAVVAISVAEADQRVKQFFERTPVNFPVLLDRDRAVTKSWKISTLPSTYILDANMKPVLVVDADFPWDSVEIDPASGKLVKSKAVATEATSDSNPKKGDSNHGL